MTNTSQDYSDRIPLGFTRAVAREFAFLAREGFVSRDVAPTLAKYTRGGTEARVYYGRSSYELGFEGERRGETYYLNEFIRAADEGAAERYRKFATMTAHGVSVGVAQLADLVKRYGRRALTDDAEYFAALDNLRTTWWAEEAKDSVAHHVRPKANEAFRQRNYSEAARLFEQIVDRLAPAERKKLELAKRRARS